MKHLEYQLQKDVCRYISLRYPKVLFLSDTIGNVKLPKIVARNHAELLRKTDRQLAAVARYLRRDDPTYKTSPIPGVSSEELDADYEEFFRLAEIEREKIKKKAKLSAKKLFGN